MGRGFVAGTVGGQGWGPGAQRAIFKQRSLPRENRTPWSGVRTMGESFVRTVCCGPCGGTRASQSTPNPRPRDMRMQGCPWWAGKPRTHSWGSTLRTLCSPAGGKRRSWHPAGRILDPM